MTETTTNPVPINQMPLPNTLTTKPTSNRFSAFKEWFKGKSTPLLVTGIIIALLVVGTLSYLFFFQNKEKLAVYAGSISITPSIEDTTGVAKNSEFILTSKEPISNDAIKDNLAIIPEVKYDLQKMSDTQYKIKPEKELNEGKIYQITLATVAPNEATPSANPTNENELSWAFQIKNPFRIVNTLPGKKATNVPVKSGIEVTFSHENFKDVDTFFEITPKVNGRFERHKRTAVFVPSSLQPGTLYTVKIKKGVELSGSEEKLNEDYIFQFETDDETDINAKNVVNFNKEFSEFPANDVPAFKVSSAYLNPVANVAVAVYRFNSFDEFINGVKSKERVPSWASYSRRKALHNTSGMQKVQEFNAPIQKLDYSEYFMLPQTLTEGYYLVETNNFGQKAQAWLQITNLATYLSVSDTKTLVWVNDIGTKQQVANATVEIIDTETKSVTGTDGSAYFDTPEIMKKDDAANYLKITDKAGKSVLAPLNTTDGYRYYEGASDITDKYWSYLYIDRPVYMPNDKVSFWGVLRDRDKLQEQQKLKVKVTRSDYSNYDLISPSIMEKELTTSEFGTFIGDFTLGGVQPGYYYLSATVGDEDILQYGFTVETYTKPAYKIELTQNKQAVYVGETVTFNGKVSFFEGTAVPNVELQYSGAGSNDAKTITTNDKGEFSVSYVPGPPTDRYTDASDTFYPYSTYPRYNGINIRPKNAEEGEIEGSASVTVFDSSVNLKIKTETTGDTGVASIEAKNIALDRLNNNTNKSYDDYLGSAAGNLAITGKLYEYTWQKTETGEYYDYINKRTEKTYQYNPIQKFLSDVAVTTDANGNANYQFPIAQDKYYLVYLEAKDGQGRAFQTYGHVYGRQGSLENGQNNYYSLQQAKDNNTNYSLNENVSMTMKKGEQQLPSAAPNKYLFRTAQRGIREYKVQNNPVLNFQFKNEFVPNVTVRGIHFDGRTYYESDTSTVTFLSLDKELKVDVKQNQQSYKPRDAVTLDLSVKDKQGKGVKSDVNISLVDEAIFAIEDSGTSILGSLYKRVAAGIINSYASHEIPLLPSGAEGGGGCFLAGTKILMNGNTYKKIEDIKEGDVILTRKNPNTDELVTARVKNPVKHKVNEYLILNGDLEVTGEHNLYVNGRWMIAAEIKTGDHILDSEGEWKQITSIQKRNSQVEVFNFTVENQGTYFANNIYVHNEKGRELFMDQAYFGSVQTDNSGNGKVSFKLPDNLTSWRITTQAVSGDIGAGSSASTLPVKLPFFADLVMSTQYLEGDKPIIGLRTFGESLTNQQQVTFTVEAPTLGIEKPLVLTSQAFTTKEFELPLLPVGDHYITVGAKAGNLEDKLTRTIHVQKSQLAKQELTFQQLKQGTKITPVTGSDQTTLIMSDQNTGRYYPMLSRIAYGYNDRVDQKVARVKAEALLKQYFNQEPFEQQDVLTKYQQHTGGIGLFPYADADLEITTKVAATAPELFDKFALISYFAKILNSKEEGNERSLMALAGLASLGEPVLVQLNNLKDFEKYTLTEQLYIAIAQARIGNKEKARAMYKSIMAEKSETTNQFTKLKAGDPTADLAATSLAATLASLINDENGEKLFQYIATTQSQEITTELDLVQYIAEMLPRLPQGASTISYTINGKKAEQKLEKGQSFKLFLNNEQLNQLSFDSVNGNVGVTTQTSTPLDVNALKKDPSIGLSRVYVSNNAKTTTFKQSNLVMIELNAQVSPGALDGCYQVTDILPAGLKPVTRLQGAYDSLPNQQRIVYPYEINGQKVNFCVDKTTVIHGPIRYYARVVSKGEYKAENALIQSQKAPDSVNITESVQVQVQ